MASWSEVERATPELAAAARGFFDRDKHKTIATLRRDGSPRISGTEANFAEGELWIGSMWRAVKALDLQRDGRFALHSPSIEQGWRGDAKVAGRMVEVTDPEVVRAINGEATGGERSHLFRADITELSVVRLGEPADHLVIESWHEGRGTSRIKR